MKNQVTEETKRVQNQILKKLGYDTWKNDLSRYNGYVERTSQGLFFYFGKARYVPNKFAEIIAVKLKEDEYVFTLRFLDMKRVGGGEVKAGTEREYNPDFTFYKLDLDGLQKKFKQITVNFQ